jgi:pilus assembly protein CpaC
MFTITFWRMLAPSTIISCFALFAIAQSPEPTEPVATPLAVPESINFEARSSNERLEMTVHSSRIITIGQKIPQAQVNNPEILDVTPLSPTQVQISAKTNGVTQVNLWGEDKKLYTIDVIVYGDAQELKMLLRSQFPNSALKVIPVGASVLISGFVDKPEHINWITRIAEEYYPKVINNMTVGGVQTVLLHVKVMEVSRTKLRNLGFDWAKITNGNVMTSGTSGLLNDATSTAEGRLFPPNIGLPAVRSSSPSTFAFSVLSGSGSAFYGVLDALRQDNLMKIMAEPTLVTESGRAASFNSGGEIPVPVPQSLGTISVDWKKYGTQIDFVPIVLGNGKIRLEVRPRISELDASHSVTIGGTTVSGIKSRDADTAVEMMAGQTLAIAGLVQSRTEAENRGLPWISEVPYLGAAFRSVRELTNEIELLILVTPELVDGMDASEVPQCGPGMSTTSPTDWELYMKGHLEVPNCCPTCGGNGCPKCKPGTDGSPTPMPEDGMIGPEQITAPTPEASSSNSRPGAKNASSKTGSTNLARNSGGSSSPYNRYTSSKPNNPSGNSSVGKPNSPPGFIGPIGYDVVK